MDATTADRQVAAAPSRQSGGTLEGLVVATFALFGLRIGLQALHDNSMFLHLRTGIWIADTGHVPRSDPYSFTAPHHAWVVQSWFAELLYGLAYRIGGLHLVVLEQGVLIAVLGAVLATLARTGSTVRTMATAGIAVCAGAALWSQRPLLFGLLCLAGLILVVERRWSPWWLLPIGWVWVNTHGSFPLGALWLGAVYVGTAVECRRRPRELERYALGFVGGLAVSVLNPIGPRLLTFPLVVQSKQKVFSDIVEWHSPNFQSGGELFALAFFSLGLLILIRRGAPWRDVLVVVGFLALGLISLRNLAPAAVVMAPALARAMRAEPRGEGAVRGTAGPTRLVSALLAAAAVVFVVASYRSAAIRYAAYPVAGEHFLRTDGMLDGRRIATQDYVGDFRELVETQDSPSKVFIDDRYDMYPAPVSSDYTQLNAAKAPAIGVLDKWHIQVVLWSRGAGLPGLLHLAGGWRTAYRDKTWEILVRDPSVPPGQPGPSTGQ